MSLIRHVACYFQKKRMKLKDALRGLSFWKNGRTRVNAKPAIGMDTAGANGAPGPDRKARLIRMFKRLIVAAAPGKIRGSVQGNRLGAPGWA